MTEGSENELVIGTVVSPFGIRGEVKVYLHTDHPERYNDLEEVDLKAPSGAVQRLKIDGVRFHKGAALVKFRGCNTMSSAEELRGSNLVVPESESVELHEDEFFIHELIGLRVYDVGGEDLGTVKEVIRGRANDAYVTDKVTIPALKSVVRKVDLAGGKMVVELPESMTE